MFWEVGRERTVLNSLLSLSGFTNQAVGGGGYFSSFPVEDSTSGDR